MQNTRRRKQTATALVLVTVLAAGGLVLGSTGQAQGTSGPHEAAAPKVAVAAKVPTRARTTIRGVEVERRVQRPTQLQRKGAKGWVTVARARAKRSGRVVYRISRPSVTTRYRIKAPRKTVRLVREVQGRRITRTVKLPVWKSKAQTLRPRQGSPWVTGYYAGWFWDQGDMLAPEDVDMSAMTHFVFGRVAPGGGSLEGGPGDLVPGAGTGHQPGLAPDGSGRSVEDYLVDRAHHAGAEALLMLGGDGYDGRGFMLSTTNRIRPTFVDNIVDYLVEHDYDGVDIDWENCLSGDEDCGEAAGQDPVPAAEARRRLMALIAEVRAEAATRAHFASDPVLVTFPGYPLNTNYQLENGKAPRWQADIALAVDQYNLMSYGVGTTFNGAGWDSWFSGALTGAAPSHPVDIASSVDAYVAAGVPRGRIGLGIGFYGVYWGPEITGPRQNTDSNEIWEVSDADLSYGALDRMGYLSHGTQHWDPLAQSTYRTYEQYGEAGYVPPFNPEYPYDDDRSPAGFLSYEDPRSIQAKGDWVKSTGAGGAIIWTLNYGWVPRTQSNPLLEAVKHAFLE